jgi:hypothetical protein
MVFNQCFQVLLPVFPVFVDEVVTYAAVDENLFDMRHLAYGFEHLYLRAVVGPESRADGGAGTGDVQTDAVLEFAFALVAVHIGGRPAHIVDDAFEIFVPFECVDLVDDRLLASAADGSALVNGDGAEVALSVTAVMGSYGELYSLKCFDLTLRFVVGVDIAFILEIIDMVYLLLFHVVLGRVLNEPAAVLKLTEPF